MTFSFGDAQPSTPLFSNPSTSGPPPTGSIFNLGASQSATSTGGGIGGGTSSQAPPFGQTTQPQTQSSSVFGGFGQQNQQKPSGNLFGQTSQPAQQPPAGGSSLFGATSQPAQTSGSSLFGQPNQQQGQGQTGGGGFGGASQSQFAPQNTVNNTSISTQPQSGDNNTSTYFTTILEKSRKRALGGMSDEDLPQLQLGLGDLRQRIKRFAPAASDKVADGRAHYLLSASGVDPGAAVRDLNFFNAGAAKLERSQPQAGSETDLEGYLANIQTQTTLDMISDGLARSIRDFDTFLEENVTMEWEAQRKRIYQHFGIKPKETATAGGNSGFGPPESQGFGRSRRSKAAALASSRASGIANASTFGKSSLQKSVIGAAAPIGTNFQPLFSDIEKRIETEGIATPDPNDRFLRERQGRLAEKVQKLNEARLRKRCYPLLHQLRDAVKEGAEEQSTSIVKAYRAVIEMIDEFEEETTASDPLAIKERSFMEAYLDVNSKSAKSIALKKRIIRGSCRHLEKIFFEQLDAYIKKSPKEANLGGVPDVTSKVRAYVRLRAARRDLAPDNTDLQMLNDDYVWALVFYLIRTGHIDEAVEYVNTNAVAFRAIDRNFSSYISDYHKSPDKRLRRDLQERINSEYNQRLRVAPENSIDPYRMACYKIIGRCELGTRTFDPTIQQSIEDYMWIQFILAREAAQIDQLATESCNLASVQAMIKDAGSRHFAKGESYGAYFYLLIMGGLYEEAIEHLYPFAYPDAVHFAIALDYYGLLRVSDPSSVAESSLLSYTTRDLPQLKFGHMVGHYTRDFRAANVAAAVDYLTFICLNRDLPGDLGRKQVELCHAAIRELILESREFALLLGDMQADGQRVSGLIEDRMQLIALNDTEDFMRTISIQAASVADDNGRVTDAVLLYHLAGEYDSVAVIIARAMSEALAVQIGQEPIRLQPLKPRAKSNSQQIQATSLSLASVDNSFELGQIMNALYDKNAMYKDKIASSNREACKLLLQVSEVRTIVEEGNWSRALDVSS
jgi:nuclear pore complex protein Nup93